MKNLSSYLWSWLPCRIKESATLAGLDTELGILRFVERATVCWSRCHGVWIQDGVMDILVVSSTPVLFQTIQNQRVHVYLRIKIWWAMTSFDVYPHELDFWIMRRYLHFWRTLCWSFTCTFFSSICVTRLFNVVTLTTWCYQYIARLRQFSRWLFTFDFWLQQVEWILKRFGGHWIAMFSSDCHVESYCLVRHNVHVKKRDQQMCVLVSAGSAKRVDLLLLLLDLQLKFFSLWYDVRSPLCASSARLYSLSA